MSHLLVSTETLVEELKYSIRSVVFKLNPDLVNKPTDSHLSYTFHLSVLLCPLQIQTNCTRGPNSLHQQSFQKTYHPSRVERMALTGTLEPSETFPDHLITLHSRANVMTIPSAAAPSSTCSSSLEVSYPESRTHPSYYQATQQPLLPSSNPPAAPVLPS